MDYLYTMDLKLFYPIILITSIKQSKKKNTWLGKFCELKNKLYIYIKILIAVCITCACKLSIYMYNNWLLNN